jgi:hypothetical protein
LRHSLRRVGVYIGAIRPRMLERPLWRFRHRQGVPEVSQEALRARFAYGREADFLDRFAEGYARRFAHVARRRESFAAVMRGLPDAAEAVLAAADRTRAGTFDVLGSGPVHLGLPPDWHRDFKSGRRWPCDVSWRIDYANLGEPSDVKVPWELSRFHYAAWLGQAYWLTGDEGYASAFGRLATSWIQDNPPGRGVNWAVPMELAIRSANWIMAFGWFRGSPSLDDGFWFRLLGSLWRHADAIGGNLEYQRLLGNHYISNGMGLVLLGTFFGDTRAGRSWARRGRRILEREMIRQVHPDGVSYEKSISYHRLVLECFYLSLILGERDGFRFSGRFHDRLRLMFEFVNAYTREDGSTPLVSDADDGRVLRLAPAAPFTDHRHGLAVGGTLLEREDLLAAAGGCHPEALWLFGPERFSRCRDASRGKVARASRAFPSGGYYVMRGPDTHTFLDAGEIGFDGHSGHGHNDTLSFELHAPGGTFIVDSGTYLYTSDTAAHRAFASTAAHNTVRVDGREIAEFAGLWRLTADETRPRVLEWTTTPAEDRWVAEHRGYRRLPEPVTHRRSVRFERAARRWTVQDALMGRGRHTAELFLHLHPDAQVASVTERAVEVRLGAGVLCVVCTEPLTMEEGWVAPSYGVKRGARVIRAVREGDMPMTITTTIEWRPASPRAVEEDGA